MLKLPDSLTIHNVGQVRQTIISYLEKQKKEENNIIAFDARSLKDIDGAGIQLLLSTLKAFGQEELSFSLVNRGKILEQLLELSGASDIVEKGVFKKK